MGPGGVFPAEMPERGRSLVDPLDDDTAERLLAGRVGPDDAPPGYAGVAAILQSASAPATPEELAGQEAALSIFLTWGPSPTVRGGRRGVQGRRERLQAGRGAAEGVRGSAAGRRGSVWRGAGIGGGRGAVDSRRAPSPVGYPPCRGSKSAERVLAPRCD